MNTKHLLAGLLWLACATAASAASKVYTLTSPSGNIEVTATTDAQGLTWAVKSGSTQVLLPSAIQAVVDGKPLIAATGSVVKKQMVESSFATPV